MLTIRTFFSRIANAIGFSGTADPLSLGSRLANGTGATADVTALFNAAVSGNVTVVETLLATRGRDIRAALDDALALAARNGRTAVAERLVHAGADVHELSDEPLRCAAAAGETRMVQFLLAAGADAHVRDDEPLRSAIANGHTDTANVLKTWVKPC